MEESVIIYQIFYIKEVFLSRGNKKIDSSSKFLSPASGKADGDEKGSLIRRHNTSSQVSHLPQQKIPFPRTNY
jgi:hypothetical protein